MATKIPDDKLATLAIEHVKENGVVDVHGPDNVVEEPWEWLDVMDVAAVEADLENYDHLIVHGKTKTDPGVYDTRYSIAIAIWWDMNPEHTAELNIEVYENE